MDARFTPRDIEAGWRDRWVELGVGVADNSSSNAAFSMALPAPNITGDLHVGHAVSFSLQDILARYHRMRGDEVEWAPGLDHAAIATQNVIERQLAAEGTTKEGIGRKAFQERVDRWYRHCGGRIFEQMRRLGFTCDWSRARFNLDERYQRSTRTAFNRFFEQGLVYRAPRIVNWCPRCSSAISDEEVEWRERDGVLAHLELPIGGGRTLPVCTTAPELLLGATAIAVSPRDVRHARLSGTELDLPITGRRVPVIADTDVPLAGDQGTMLVIPAHGYLDHDLARRHGLEVVEVLGADGVVSQEHRQVGFAGMSLVEARERALQALIAAGVVESWTTVPTDTPHCDRCGGVVHQRLSDQWWLNVEPIKQAAIDAVEKGEIVFVPEGYADVHLGWMRRLHDWCLSRQIWLGHRIPVSTCGNGHQFCWMDEPTSCKHCGDTNLTHEPDVLDTWFGASLFTWAVFGWPEETPDMRAFYPTDVVVTAHDVLFLWISRAIMTGYFLTGRPPFRTVVVNSTISAADGTRMGKTRGNAVDPMELVEKYSADAVRVWAASVATSSQAVRYDEQRVQQAQHFATKVWNLTRFLATRLDDGTGRIAATPEPAWLAPEDRWILARTAQTLQECQEDLDSHRLEALMDRIWKHTWHSVCDWYVEMVKPRLTAEASPESFNAAAWTSATVLDVLLRFLHPFMPYVTEECAQRLASTTVPSLDMAEWPVANAGWLAQHSEVATAVGGIVEVVQELRAALRRARVPGKDRDRSQVVLRLHGAAISMQDATRLVELLAPVRVVAHHPDNVETAGLSGQGIEAWLHITAPAEVDVELIGRRHNRLVERIERLRAQLAEPHLHSSAPRAVIDGMRHRLEELERERAGLVGVLRS